MKARDALVISLSNLSAHKMRSALAMLGVVFGVGAVIAMLSIGAGAEKEALESKLKDLIVIRDQAAARERSFLEVEQELQAEIAQMAGAKTALAQHEDVLREDK